MPSLYPLLSVMMKPPIPQQEAVISMNLGLGAQRQAGLARGEGVLWEEDGHPVGGQQPELPRG